MSTSRISQEILLGLAKQFLEMRLEANPENFVVVQEIRELQLPPRYEYQPLGNLYPAIIARIEEYRQDDPFPMVPTKRYFIEVEPTHLGFHSHAFPLDVWESSMERKVWEKV